MSTEKADTAQAWRTTHGDMTDTEWELIADLVAPGWKPGAIGRPATVDRRRVVDAIFYVAATGCQWRALPDCYPNWNTVHRLHLAWSRDGTWERIAGRLTEAVRQAEGRDPDPSVGIVDARTVRGAATVTSETRGYDAGKKISGRKVFGVVDSLGLLLAVVVMAANTSDNAGGAKVFDQAEPKSKRLAKMFCDAGFKKTFLAHCRTRGVATEVVNRIHASEFHVLPKRWVVERTWGWLTHHRRLQIDYERDPTTTEGFIWAAHSRTLLRRLTTPPPTP